MFIPLSRAAQDENCSSTGLGQVISASELIARAKAETAKRLALEQFPSPLNREGFPNQLCCDSSCMLVEEASMHGPSPVFGSS